METSVGLLVMIEMGGELHALLQRRGEYNFEGGDIKPESWPGGYQVTAHGKILPDEQYEEAMFRECIEELGRPFTQTVRRAQKGGRMTILSDETKSDGQRVVTFGAIVSRYELEQIRLHPGTGGLTLVKVSDCQQILDLRGFDRKKGLIQRDLAMFDDELKSLKTAFQFMPNLLVGPKKRE